MTIPVHTDRRARAPAGRGDAHRAPVQVPNVHRELSGRRRAVADGPGGEIELEASPESVVRRAEVGVEMDLLCAGDGRHRVKRFLPAEAALLAVHASAERDPHAVGIEQLSVQVR